MGFSNSQVSGSSSLVAESSSVEQGPGIADEGRIVLLEVAGMTVRAVHGAGLHLIGVVAEDPLDQAWSLPPGAVLVSARGALDPDALPCLVVKRLGTVFVAGQAPFVLLVA